MRLRACVCGTCRPWVLQGLQSLAHFTNTFWGMDIFDLNEFNLMNVLMVYCKVDVENEGMKVNVHNRYKHHMVDTRCIQNSSVRIQCVQRLLLQVEGE